MTPALFFLCLFVAGLAGATVYVALPRGRGGLRSRIAAFAEPSEALPKRGSPRAGRERLGEKGLGLAERMLERTAWWHRLKRDAEIAEFPVAPLPYALGTLAATVALAAALALVSWVIALLALGMPLVARMLVTGALRRKRERFAEQLPDSLLRLAASLRAGHSFATGLRSVVDEAGEPSRGELERAVADLQLGVSIEESLSRVAERMENGDLEQVALVASLQQETGGNTAEVLDTVIETIRQRFAMRRLVRTLTAEGRMAQWVLTGIPITIGSFIALVNPSYLSPLVHTGSGQVMFVLAIALVGVGFVSIKRILSIEL